MISRDRVHKMHTHFKRRLRKYGLKESDGNMNAFRTTGSPCSCAACSGEKYSRKEKHKTNYMKERYPDS